MTRSMAEADPESTSQETEIERYLRSGDHDLCYSVWPGEDLFARARNGEAALRRALVARGPPAHAGREA